MVEYINYYNVRFENINIEHTPGVQIFDLRITNSA